MCQNFKFSSESPLLRHLFPDGEKQLSEVNKRPLTGKKFSLYSVKCYTFCNKNYFPNKFVHYSRKLIFFHWFSWCFQYLLNSSAGLLFKNSMAELVGELFAKEPLYVRCIKPNEHKSSVEFNVERVVHQVFWDRICAVTSHDWMFVQIRYLGLLENIRVRRAGFPYRVSYDRFIQRLSLIMFGNSKLKGNCFYEWFLQKVLNHLINVVIGNWAFHIHTVWLLF